MLGVVLAGLAAFLLLPTAPVPQIDYPVISISASMPGASPETMASSVATPLERRLGQIAGVTEMTSSSSLGSTRISLQFDLDRNIDGAQRDIQAAIAAARADLPHGAAQQSDLPHLQSSGSAGRDHRPDLGSADLRARSVRDRLQHSAAEIRADRGRRSGLVGGSALPAVRVEINPRAVRSMASRSKACAPRSAQPISTDRRASIDDGDRRLQIYANDQSRSAPPIIEGLIIAYRNGAPIKLERRRRGRRLGRGHAQLWHQQRPHRRADTASFRQPGANFIEVVDRIKALMPPLTAALPADVEMRIVQDRTLTIRASLHEIEIDAARHHSSRRAHRLSFPAGRARDAFPRASACPSR